MATVFYIFPKSYLPQEMKALLNSFHFSDHILNMWFHPRTLNKTTLYGKIHDACHCHCIVPLKSFYSNGHAPEIFTEFKV